MPSERVQRQIDRLLDEAEQSLGKRDWAQVSELCQYILTLDPADQDARVFLATAKVGLGETPGPETAEPASATAVGAQHAEHRQHSPAPPVPASFVNGRYAVKRFLGEGGKKLVYLAHDSMLDRDVAFALIKTDGLDDAGRERITREAQAMGRLGSHPHIVAVYDVGEEHTQPFIVTELMGGGDVEGLIDKAPEHRPPLERSLEISIAVCRGLEFAHGQGIVHRDLKPGNVWLTADGTAKIGDFGLAVSLDRSRLTQQGMMVGTVSYMPPEQAMGGEVTPRSDLYSLGAMLYELVTGRPPFVGDESVAIITQHLNVPPVAPTWHNPACPPALETLILRLLEKDPAKRPASAAEVREALGHVNLSSQPPPRRGEGEAMGEAVTSPLAGGKPQPLRQESIGTPERPGERSPDNPMYRHTFVGREGELRQLQGAFDSACSGQGALTTVVGEPGIGKTALCEQLATYVAVRGGKALVGHCYEEGSLSLPYLPFVEALRSYVLTREPEQLRSELGTGAADVARIVSEIRDRVQVELRSAGDADDDRWRLYQSVTSFLRNAAAVQPLLIVLEDLHWADRGTLDFLLHLSRNLAGARLLIVGTYRDVEVDRAHPLSATLGELRRGSSFARVPLRGLTTDEVHRMLSALAAQEVRWSLAEAVHRQTEGNPLFIQEVLRYLVEEGLITREDGRWRRTGEAPVELSIPEGLRDVIGRRLSRLGPACNQLLAVAAVIGRDFDLAVLQAVSTLDEDAVLAALEEAMRVGVLEEQVRPGGGSYRFTHAFFRQTLYEEMLAPRRLRLHQQVARALESRYGTRLEEHAAELAEHFAQSTDAADLSKAVHYSELAARRSIAVYAYGEAVRLLEQALAVHDVVDPDDREQRCDLLLELGRALMPAGDPLRAANEIAEEALAIAEALGDTSRASWACQLALQALFRYGAGPIYRTPEYALWAERADRYAAPESLERVYVDLALGNVTSPSGTGAGHECRQRALELARRLGDNEAFYVAAWHVLRETTIDGIGDRLQLAEELLSRSTDGVSVNALAWCRQFQGVVFMNCCRREQAERIYQEVQTLGSRSRDPDVVLSAFRSRMSIARADGRFDAVLEERDRLLEASEEWGSPLLGRYWASFQSAGILVWLGRVEEVLASLTPDIETGSRSG